MFVDTAASTFLLCTCVLGARLCVLLGVLGCSLPSALSLTSATSRSSRSTVGVLALMDEQKSDVVHARQRVEVLYLAN